MLRSLFIYLVRLLCFRQCVENEAMNQKKLFTSIFDTITITVANHAAFYNPTTNVANIVPVRHTYLQIRLVAGELSSANRTANGFNGTLSFRRARLASFALGLFLLVLFDLRLPLARGRGLVLLPVLHLVNVETLVTGEDFAAKVANVSHFRGIDFLRMSVVHMIIEIPLLFELLRGKVGKKFFFYKKTPVKASIFSSSFKTFINPLFRKSQHAALQL